MKQLARQSGWQDVLTKLYIKESYESRVLSQSNSLSSPTNSLDPVLSRPVFRREDSVMEDTRQNVYISLTARHEEEYEEEESQDASEGYSDLSQSPPSTGQLKSDSLHFKPFDSGEQSSHSSTLSNTVDIPSPSRLLEEEESVYQPLSPFNSPFELEISLQKGPQTPVGSQPETPSPLEHSKSFPGMRPRKSSSLSNVLDDTSYCTEPPTDTISNTSNPQVHAELGVGNMTKIVYILFHGNDIYLNIVIFAFNKVCMISTFLIP